MLLYIIFITSLSLSSTTLIYTSAYMLSDLKIYIVDFVIYFGGLIYIWYGGLVVFGL